MKKGNAAQGRMDDAGQISFEMFVVLLGLLIVAIFVFTSLGSSAKGTAKNVDESVDKFSKKLQDSLGG
ncbi:hypothetical protein HYS54_04300 [Candidatus Micrarchaeota archaeon]|nr:hypothetical protein [Candidatus Micrarchaeota archaeon]